MRLEPALRDRWVPMVGASCVRPWYVAGAYIPGRVGALPTIEFIRAPLECQDNLQWEVDNGSSHLASGCQTVGW